MKREGRVNFYSINMFMSRMVLYRKYRSMNFDEVVGQEHVVRSLRNAVKTGEVSHALLFAGARGIGKTSLARILARAVNCKNITNDGNPCNQCDICQAFFKQASMDLIEVDAASHRGIDDIRFLQEGASFAPVEAKKKVFIIDEVHMLTKEAFNALLKTLEEPPSHCIFILATTEINKVPETILSRCQTYYFERISVDEMMKHLIEVAEQEGVKLEEKESLMIANSVKGGMRDALGILEQLLVCSNEGKIDEGDLYKLLGVVEESVLNNIYDLMQTGKMSETISFFHNEVYRKGVEVDRLLISLEDFFRKKMLEDDFSDGKRAEKWAIVFEELTRSRQENFEIDTLNFELFVIRTIGRWEKAKLIVEEPSPKEEKVVEQEQSVAVDSGVDKNDWQDKRPEQNVVDKKDVDELIKIWIDFVGKIAGQNPLLASIIRMSEARNQSGKLEISVPYVLQKRQLESNGNMDFLRQVAKQLIGKEVDIIICVNQQKSAIEQKRNMISQQIQDRVAEETGDSLKKEVETIFEGEEV